jgi:uncharacterized OsmC-like protein
VRIRAHVRNREGDHQVTLQTNGTARFLHIPPKSTGSGSSANGGELLFLALATCYCNDIYREAARRGIKVDHVEVEVAGEFAAEGAPATNVSYRARVEARADQAVIRDLMESTDRVAEIQNTLRMSTPVTLTHMDVVSV